MKYLLLFVLLSGCTTTDRFEEGCMASEQKVLSWFEGKFYIDQNKVNTQYPANVIVRNKCRILKQSADSEIKHD